MFTDLTSAGVRLAQLLDGPALARLQHAAGRAAKTHAREAAAAKIGTDMTLSGLARKAKLSTGYDTVGDDMVRLNFRPYGLWKLTDDGRRNTRTVYPRRRRAVLTPYGPRAHARPGPARGQGTLKAARHGLDTAVTKALRVAVDAEIRRVCHG